MHTFGANAIVLHESYSVYSVLGEPKEDFFDILYLIMISHAT